MHHPTGSASRTGPSEHLANILLLNSMFFLAIMFNNYEDK